MSVQLYVMIASSKCNSQLQESLRDNLGIIWEIIEKVGIKITIGKHKENHKVYLYKCVKTEENFKENIQVIDGLGMIITLLL